MLQQTQTGRVAPVYESFLAHFPTVEALAHAPAMDVIQAWRGLGYNRRAVDLHRAAQAIVGDYGGEFPSEPRTLIRLGGLGEYTAHAVACFAFDAQVPVVDTNVRRVLARVALGKDAAEAPAARVAALAKTWLPAGEAYRWNQALMDLGAMVCRVSTPLCAQCPLARVCAYKAAGRNRGAAARTAAARAAAARATKPKERFEGSRRQVRGGIVEHLRRAARKGVTLAALDAKMHPNGGGSIDDLVEVLLRLEQEGLAELTPGARRGSPRGIVRLPR